MIAEQRRGYDVLSSNDRVAIVTGAGSGIGRAVSLALIQRGYRVVLVGRRKDRLEETAAEGIGVAANAVVIAADVRQPADVSRLYEETLKIHGRVDVVFNNAGVPSPRVTFDNITYEQWQDVVAINLTGAFLVAQGAFRAMKNQSPQGGRIINNGSVSASAPRPDSAPYTATKHAITGLTKAISLDGRKYNIACGQIDIGNADTAMTAALSEGIVQSNGTRMIEPTMPVVEVGEAVAYMASLPLDANVQFMTLMATKMPFIGRG
jgi:NAD(P)-dependent dehydrogenase (short-subunit alcohol dehydrogenase family)